MYNLHNLYITFIPSTYSIVLEYLLQLVNSFKTFFRLDIQAENVQKVSEFYSQIRAVLLLFLQSVSSCLRWACSLDAGYIPDKVTFWNYSRKHNHHPFAGIDHTAQTQAIKRGIKGALSDFHPSILFLY
jgi:hypothetical protein